MSVDALDVPDPTRNTVILPSLGTMLAVDFFVFKILSDLYGQLGT